MESMSRRSQEGLQCRGLLHFRNQCPNARGGQLTSGDRTRSSISQRFVAKPTARSADGTTLSASRQWPRGADGVCTAQPAVNRESVPAQQPARVVRKAHVFDEVADAWREILEVVSMPVSEPDTPHIPPPDFVPKKEMSCKALQHLEATPNCGARHEYKRLDTSVRAARRAETPSSAKAICAVS